MSVVFRTVGELRSSFRFPRPALKALNSLFIKLDEHETKIWFKYETDFLINNIMSNWSELEM